MNLKKIITTLSFLLLLSCGYEPIYSTKQINSNYNFSINTINYTGDNKVNRILKNQLQKNLNKEKKSTKLNLNLNSRVEKVVTSKDKKGNPKRFLIKIIINLEVYESEILKSKANFKEKFEYNNRSNKFDLRQYEKNIQNNLIKFEPVLGVGMSVFSKNEDFDAWADTGNAHYLTNCEIKDFSVAGGIPNPEATMVIGTSK